MASLEIVASHRQEIVERPRFDDQLAIHIGFADGQERLQAKAVGLVHAPVSSKAKTLRTNR